MAYTPPAGSQIISAGKGNNYYVYTQNGVTLVVTTNGLVLATTTNQGQSYNFSSKGNQDNNLKSALSNPQSSASKTVKQNAGKPTTNAASASQQQPQQGAAPPAPDLNNPGVFGTITPTAYVRMAPSEGLRYPLKMKSEQDKIKFQAVQLSERTGRSFQQTQFSFGQPKYVNADDGPVIMAIQSPISDQNSVDWGPNSVNATDAAIYNLSYSTIKFDGTTDGQIKNLYKNLMENDQRIQRFLAGQAASINNVLARTDNIVLNPNLELLFQGPQLRPFTFQFKLSARSKKEANVVKSIINYFKYHMAVRNEEQLFLKAPHVFKIDYYKGEDTIHSGIGKISNGEDTKACALTNFSVDYTPLGSYATYQDGTMVSYTISMQFQEITPVYDTDYAKFGYDENTQEVSIGF